MNTEDYNYLWDKLGHLALEDSSIYTAFKTQKGAGISDRTFLIQLVKVLAQEKVVLKGLLMDAESRAMPRPTRTL